MRTEKQIFVVHTESSARERALFESLHACLEHSPLKAWSYEDWSWEAFLRDRNKRSYARSGMEIDPYRAMIRHPKPFIRRGRSRRVDVHTLRRILRHSAVVIVVEPAGKVTEGVQLEISEIERILGDGHNPNGRPVLVQCCFPDSRPVTTPFSAFDTTQWRRWRACYRLLFVRENENEELTRNDLHDCARALVAAATAAAFLNTLPRELGPRVGFRLLSAIQAGHAPSAVQDSVLRASATTAALCPEPPLLEWQKVRERYSRALQTLSCLGEEDWGSVRVIPDSLFFHTRPACKGFFHEITEDLRSAIDEVDQLLAEWVPTLDLERVVPFDLVFTDGSLHEISSAVQLAAREAQESWDQEIARRIRSCFGWCDGDLPPDSPEAVLSLAKQIAPLSNEIRLIVEKLFVFAFLVQERFRYETRKPYWYSTFFGEALIQFCSIAAHAEAGSPPHIAVLPELAKRVSDVCDRDLRPRRRD